MAENSLRIDKWLWHARFCKTRALAQRKAAAGLIRINGRRIEKPGSVVHPGDVVIVPVSREVIALRVIALGSRRGPPSEARTLYELLDA